MLAGNGVFQNSLRLVIGKSVCHTCDVPLRTDGGKSKGETVGAVIEDPYNVPARICIL